MSVVRTLRLALVVLLVTVFACWPQLAGPSPSALPADPMPSPLPVTVLPTQTVFVFASATPTAQAAERLPTRAGASTATPTFSPIPTRTATPEVTRVPVQRG